MSTEIIPANAIESAIMMNDLSKLTTEQRLLYVNKICTSLGLNPLTQPFNFITFKGKTVLYATKSCTDQLRKIHGVSISIISKEQIGDIYMVTTRATDKTGKTDEDTGAIVVGHLKGDDLANALMKCVTKSKRRVTLSVCGLGILDESEFDTMGHTLAPEQVEKIVSDAQTLDYSKRQSQLKILSDMAGRLTMGLGIKEKNEWVCSVLGVQKWGEIEKFNNTQLAGLIKKLDDLVIDEAAKNQ